MIVKCNKIISQTTRKALDGKSQWVKEGKEYVVLSLHLSALGGVQVCIKTEHYSEPRFMYIDGFEFISQNIPKSWTVIVNKNNDDIFVTMLPKSWSYDTFFEDLDDEDPKALELYKKEAEILYREEGLNIYSDN